MNAGLDFVRPVSNRKPLEPEMKDKLIKDQERINELRRQQQELKALQENPDAMSDFYSHRSQHTT
jgi:hypothetical protein